MNENTEQARLAELHRLEILDTPPEKLFDRFVSLAAETFGVPMAAISLGDAERQWFKALVGLTARQTPRDIAFCDHAIRTDRAMVVADATLDYRFRDNPLVTEPPSIRFYAGAPLTAEGHRLGTLCIMDVEPRTGFGGSRQLECLAESVAQALVVRKAEMETKRIGRLAADRRLLLELAEKSSHLVLGREREDNELVRRGLPHPRDEPVHRRPRPGEPVGALQAGRRTNTDRHGHKVSRDDRRSSPSGEAAAAGR